MFLIGEDCSLENLSVVTEQTGGEVERVDPKNIAKNFQSILTTPIIATGCMATILLHRGLMFKNEVADELEVFFKIFVVVVDFAFSFYCLKY